MRLMLGWANTPSLLVDVEKEYGPNHFDFWVVNGAWDGTYNNGQILIHRYPDNSPTEHIDILCNDQDRLRGDYNTVFANFDNPNYRAPKHKEVEMSADWDDDIPF